MYKTPNSYIRLCIKKRRGRISKIKFYLGKDNLELVSFLRDNIAVYPKDLVILNVCEGSRAGTSHETFVRSFTSFWMTTDAKPRAKISLLNLC